MCNLGKPCNIGNIWCTVITPMFLVIKLSAQSHMAECCACQYKVSQMTEGLKLCTVSAPLAKNFIPQHVNHVSMEMQLTVMLSALNMHACVEFECLLPRGMLATW